MSTAAIPICKCGHSYGSHGLGRPRDMARTQANTYWGCVVCPCEGRETVEEWADALMRRAIEYNGIEGEDGELMRWWKAVGRALFLASRELEEPQ